MNDETKETENKGTEEINAKQEIEKTQEYEKKEDIQLDTESVNNTNDTESIENMENAVKKPKIINEIFKVISITTQTILWILIILMIALILLTAFSRRTDIFGYRLYIVMSGSMEPAINVRDAIITKEIDEPQQGDIIAYENENIVTVHRIVKVYTQENNRLYQTKGDNNNIEDRGLVQQSQVRGKLMYRLPLLGRALIFVQSHLIAFMVVIGVLIMAILIRRLI